MQILIFSSSCTIIFVTLHNNVVAVDINPAENALLELKIAAIKHLSYENYLLVLGDKRDSTHNTIARCCILTELRKINVEFACNL